MKRFIKKYLPFSKASFLNLFAYKFVAIGWLFINIISIVFTIFIWSAVYHTQANNYNLGLDEIIINGFNYKDIISYSIFTFIFTFTVSASSTFNDICDEVREGSIAIQLIKPISYRFRFIFASIGNLLAMDVIFGLPLLVISYTFLSLINYIAFISVWDILIKLILFILSQILACLLIDAFNYIFGLFTFYTQASFGLYNIKLSLLNFLSGGLIPISFLMNSSLKWASTLGNIISKSPFIFMNEYPVFILVGKVSYQNAILNMIYTIFWIFVIELLGKLLYSSSIKKLEIQGG